MPLSDPKSFEKYLPSFILMKAGLLENEFEGKISIENYDYKKFVELNRGFSSLIAFYEILNKNYKELIKGQSENSALTEQQFTSMHNSYITILNNDSLKIAASYMIAFNDLSKSKKWQDAFLSIS